MAAPTLVAFSFVNATSLTGVNVTIPDTLTWQTGDIVVALAGDEGGSTVTANALSNGGSGLTFTRNQNLFANGTFCGIAGYTATASAGSSGTVSFNETYTGGANTNKFLGVYIFRGSAGVGASTVTAAPGTTDTVNLATAAHSSIAWLVLDFSAAAAAGFTPSATSHSNVSPGPKATPTSLAVGTAYTYYCGELDDQAAAGTNAYGTTATAGKYSIVAVEITAGASAASPAATAGPAAFKVGPGPQFQPTVSYDSTPPATAAAYVAPPPVVVDQSVKRAGFW